MHLSLIVVVAFAAVAKASAIPRRSSQLFSKNNSTTTLLSRDDDPAIHYDCYGSTMCPVMHVRDCDGAVNDKLIRNDVVNYGAAGSGKPHLGVCRGINTDYGCAVFIEGPDHCVKSGNDIWWDYQEIRNSGCHHCGHKYWGDGCMTTINYEPECHKVS
ncbi:hypothetical protein GGR54DRAFT_639947 [Hypoxylon sp. NC1633]|nr:hypothetical protein GGR54DRAFT_639947 [Hypoxylon sp. NC1633]